MRTTIKHAAYAALIATTISGAALVSTGNASAATQQDFAFLRSLDGQGINYANSSTAIAIGQSVCASLDTGATPIGIARGIREQNLQLPDYDTGFFIGAAIHHYCSRHQNHIDRSPMSPRLQPNTRSRVGMHRHSHMREQTARRAPNAHRTRTRTGSAVLISRRVGARHPLL